MKWVTQLSDEELTSLYQLFMGEQDKFVDLTITRSESSIGLEGHIRIPESDIDYADEDGMCEIDDDYDITDYNVKAYHHSENMTKVFRSYMYKKFGIAYAEDYLLKY